MNNGENKKQTGLKPVHPSHFKMYTVVDEEQCEKTDIPMHYWYLIYQNIRSIKQNIGSLKNERNNIITWLEKLEQNQSINHEIKHEIRNNAVNRIKRIDMIFHILYTEELMMNEIIDDLRQYLPEKEI